MTNDKRGDSAPNGDGTPMAASDTVSKRENRRREIAAAKLLGIAGERIQAGILRAPTRQISATEMLALATGNGDEELRYLSQLLECPEEVLAMLRDGDGTVLELDEIALVRMAKRLGIARDTFMAGLLVDLESRSRQARSATGTGASASEVGSRPDDSRLDETPRWETLGVLVEKYQEIWDEMEEWRPPRL